MWACGSQGPCERECQLPTLTHLLRLCCSQCLLILFLRDAVAVWVFSQRLSQEVPPLAIKFARRHEVSPLVTEVVAGRAAEWYDGQ